VLVLVLALPGTAAGAVGAEGPGPAPSGTLSVGPGVVFSAARAVCAGAGWPAGAAVSTQWLLDGAPLAGATGATFTPPRADDGHSLSCSQTATEGGSSRTVEAPARPIHEQPPQPSWPISPVARACAAPVCMQEGAGPGATGEAYAQAGAWWGAKQIRCVSAPWTSVVGDSPVPGVSLFAEAHLVRLSLQRIDPAGPVTIAAGELSGLAVASDSLDGPEGPFGRAVVAAFGAEPFAPGELWSRVFPAASGRPNWFAPQGGLLSYALDGEVPRSVQLTYTLAASDLGSRLRCVASALDGPAAAPTGASFASAEYPVATSARCGPRRLVSLRAPQPALLAVGDPRCLAVPSALPAVGAGLQGIAVKGDRLALALDCALRAGCSGRLTLTSGTKLAGAAVRLRAGAERIVQLSLGPAAVRRVARAGHAGLPVTVRLTSGGGVRMLAVARLIGR